MIDTLTWNSNCERSAKVSDRTWTKDELRAMAQAEVKRGVRRYRNLRLMACGAIGQAKPAPNSTAEEGTNVMEPIEQEVQQPVEGADAEGGALPEAQEARGAQPEGEVEQEADNNQAQLS